MPPSRKRLGCALFAISLLLLTVFALYQCTRGFGPRESANRAKKHAILSNISFAAKAYQQEHNSTPTLDNLIPKYLDPSTRDLFLEFSRVTPITPNSPTTPLPILVQITPNRAVKKGELWGGPGEYTDTDIPASRFILLPDFTITQIDEPDYQRTIAPYIKPSPTK